MSKRRAFGDVVELDDEDEGPYLARILAPVSGEGYDECPQIFLGGCSDPECREWWTLEEVNSDMKPTGVIVYHRSECDTRDAPGPRTKF